MRRNLHLTSQLYDNVTLWSCRINGEPGVAIVMLDHVGEGKIAIMPLFVAITERMNIEFAGEQDSGGGGGGPKNPKEQFDAVKPAVTSPAPR